MSTRTILLPVVVDLEQRPVAAQISIALIGAPPGSGGGIVIAQTAAGAVTGGERVFTTALDAVTPVGLTPNTEIAPASAYRLVLALPGGLKRAWEVQIPPGEAAIPWAELIDMGAALDPADLSALALHLADAARHVPAAGASPDGSLLGLVGGLPAWSAAPAGAGDMLTATYDPRGIGADAFDRANHTGTQPLASIEDAGSAAAADVGTAAGNVVQLDGEARLPAVDGSQLTGLSRQVSPPASDAAPGSPGQWAVDDQYVYLCVASNDWWRWLAARTWTA